MTVRPTILLAAGGTGGHIFPGLAIAGALETLADVAIVFVGTARGLESRILPERGYELELLDAAPIKGGGARRAIRGAFIAGHATIRALGIVRKRAPRVVVSIGGYAAGPVSLAAASMRVPLAVVEPNHTFGFANRLLAPIARRVYVAWDETAARAGKPKMLALGVPLRPGFSPRPYEARGTARVLVLGGSQGALALDDRLPDAIMAVAKRLPGLEVVHQAGAERAGEVIDAYARNGFTRAKVIPFIEDVPSELAQADLVIARSGASAVAEIAAIGRASILIPFPHAADDHQAKNAQALARTGGALCIRQEAADCVRLASEIQRLLGDDELRVRMANAARASGKPDAADRIARNLLELLGIPMAARTLAGLSPANGASLVSREVR